MPHAQRVAAAPTRRFIILVGGWDWGELMPAKICGVGLLSDESSLCSTCVHQA